MYIGHGRLCPSLTAFPHYCTDPNITWGMVGVPSSCALLGGFAICARISLLRQQSAEREVSASACTRSVPVWMIYALTCRYFPPHLRCCHLVHLTLALRWLCKVGFAMFLDIAQHNCWYINIIAFYLLQSIASSASVGLSMVTMGQIQIVLESATMTHQVALLNCAPEQSAILDCLVSDYHT